MGRVGDTRVEVLEALQRGQVGLQRVAVRLVGDERSDTGQDVIAAENPTGATVSQTDVGGMVAGGVQYLERPRGIDVDLLAIPDRVGGRHGRACPDGTGPRHRKEPHLVIGGAVLGGQLGHLGLTDSPVVVAGDVGLAALVHHQPIGVCAQQRVRTAHVVRMHVCADQTIERRPTVGHTFEPGPEFAEALIVVDAAVDDRQAVVSLDDVAVDRPRAGQRQGQRDPVDARAEGNGFWRHP